MVWRPRWSASRAGCVAISGPSESALTSVDFPTPEEPRKATVRPGAHQGASATRAAASRASRATTRTSGEMLSAAATTVAMSSQRSGFVTTITASAPASSVSAT